MFPKSYRVINDRLLHELAHQLRIDAPETTSRTTGWSLGARGAAAKGERSREYGVDRPELVEAVVAALRDKGLLHVFRPERVSDFYERSEEHVYVFETDMDATPVYLPITDIDGSIPAGVGINIWISDPQDDLQTPSQNEWDWAGSFLLLVEEMEADHHPGRRGFVSGLSALRMIVESALQREVPPIGRGHEESGADDFGRWNPAHPIQKLEAIGGRRGRTRRIETVYRVVYMTNEQSYTVNGQEVRTNDMFAYPLYIAE